MKYALKGNMALTELLLKLVGPRHMFGDWDRIEDIAFKVIDVQPEDLNETLEHFPPDEIKKIAKRLGVLNTDIIGLVITELEPEI